MLRRALSTLVLAILAVSIVGCGESGGLDLKHVSEILRPRMRINGIAIVGPASAGVAEPVFLEMRVDVTDEDGQPLPTVDLTLESPTLYEWQVAPEGAMVVDGTFTASKPGTYTVGATGYGHKAAHEIVATGPVAIAMSIEGPSQTTLGTRHWLEVRVELCPPPKPQACEDAERRAQRNPTAFTWSVLPSDGATVDAEGVFGAFKPGTYTVRAEGLGLSATRDITASDSTVATYAGTFKRKDKLYSYLFDLRFTVDGAGVVTGTLVEDQTLSGGGYAVRWEAMFNGTVDEGGSLKAAGHFVAMTDLLKNETKQGDTLPFTLTGTIKDGAFDGKTEGEEAGTVRMKHLTAKRQ